MKINNEEIKSHYWFLKCAIYIKFADLQENLPQQTAGICF